MSRSRYFVLSSLFLGWTVLGVSSYADSKEQMEKQLAGTRAREWVLTAWVSYLGPGDKKCKEGESYRFKTDRTVTISRCVNGEIQDETKTWGIESDELETRLTVGSVLYILKFSDEGKAHIMTLRIKPPIIIKKTEDMIFRLAED